MRVIIKSRRGAALIIVICIMAVMMALSLTLLSSAGLLVANSQRGYRQEQVRIAATTLNDCVRAEMDGKDALTEEEGTLSKYLSGHIRPLTNSGWEYYASAEAAAADKYSKMHTSVLNPGAMPEGFGGAFEKAEIGIYYIANAAEITSGVFASQCSTVRLVVASTVYGVDGEQYTVKSAYGLNGETIEDVGNVAAWVALEKLP